MKGLILCGTPIAIESHCIRKIISFAYENYFLDQVEIFFI